MEYQTVKVRGQFLHDKELYLGPRTLIEDKTGKKGGVFTVAPKSGYLVITPFKIEGREYDNEKYIKFRIFHKFIINFCSETILVNRGWVPKIKKNPLSRTEGQIEGVVEIDGVVRKHENRPQFMPKMKDDQLFLFRYKSHSHFLKAINFIFLCSLFRDVNRMSEIIGCEPYLLDATVRCNVPNGPIGGQTTVALRNEHLSYVITWFSLSGLSAYFWYKMVYTMKK